MGPPFSLEGTKMSRDGEAGCGCMVWIGLMLFNLTIGGWCFDYALYSFFGKNIHFVGDMLCGLVLGEVAVPAALVCLILRTFGLEAPFFT
jgi:hypothetical protein